MLKGLSLSWRDLECTVHPQGSGLLAIVGGSWSEASAGTAGLGVDEVGSSMTQAGAGEETLAETHWK